MYIRRPNASRTSNMEKESTSEETKQNYEDTRQVDLSRSAYYGLTWTPSRDEKFSTDEIAPLSLSSSPPILDTTRISDRRIEFHSSKPYELSHSRDLPKADREQCFEMHTKRSPRTHTTASSSNDSELCDYWLSGEKFFKTPPKYIYNIPTRDCDNIEGITKDKEHNTGEIVLYDREKMLINKIDDLKPTKEYDDDVINKIRRSSSSFPQSNMEGNVMKKHVDDPPSSSTIGNVKSSQWNLVESVTTLGKTNVHNHIYLSSSYLDRYFDTSLSKFLKLIRKNSRVRCIRRRILKKPKRSKSHLVGVTCRINSAIKIESMKKNSNKKQKDRVISKRGVCDVLSEIDNELTANLKSVERLRELLPSCIPLDTIFTTEIKRTLNEIMKRCKDSMHNSNDREESLVKMDDRLLKIVFELLDLIKREKNALLQEEQYYTRLQSVSILGRQDFQKIKRLRDDAERITLNGFRQNLSHWKELVKQLLNDTLTLTNEICTIEDNKENIKKSINRKTNDRDAAKKFFTVKLDGNTNSTKKEKRLSMKKESQIDTQMSLLSKVQPTASIGKFKISTKDLDGYRDRIKMKEIGDQRNRVLKENEDRAERQSLENPKVCDIAKQLAFRRKRQSSTNTPQPVWKPGGAFKSFGIKSSTLLNSEPLDHRTLPPALRDKENPDYMRSVVIKHANPSEPTASGKNILKENQKSENFRDERVTRLFKLLAPDKTQKKSKYGANVLSGTRSSTYTQSEMPLSDTSGAKPLVKTSEINLYRQRSVPKPRPGIRRFTNNNKTISNNLQQDTKSLLDAKSQTLPLKDNLTDKDELNEPPSNLDEKNLLNQQKSKELVTFDTVEPSMILLDDKENLQNTELSKIMDNELTKNVSRANSISPEPQKSPVTILNSNITTNMNYDIESESQPSFVSVTDVSCNVELDSNLNSSMMVPSSKRCQISSLSSLSSKTCLNTDQPFDKNQSIEKDSLKSSTDDESNYQTPLSLNRPKRKNKHELSLDSLKEVLHDLGIGVGLIQQIEKEYQLKNQGDRRKSMIKSPSNIPKSFTSTAKSSIIETSIDSKADIQSSEKYEFKSDNNRSIEFKGSSDCSISMSVEKIEKSMLGGKKSASSQTRTDTEDAKSDCSAYVNSTESCYQMSLETSYKDVATEIVDEDKSILSSQRTVETQTNLHFSSTGNILELDKENEEKQIIRTESDTEDQICEQSNSENQDNTLQQDVGKNDNNKSIECLLHLKEFTIAESSVSHSLINQLEDIKEQLQNVGEKLNKLHEPTKETSDACSQISTITSKPIEISTTSMTSGISKESLEEFNIDFMEIRKNRMSSDIVNAFQTIAWYTPNWNEALGIYREYSNSKRFMEYEKSSTFNPSSNEAVNISEKIDLMECNIPASFEAVNKNSDRLCENEETEIHAEKVSRCVFQRPFYKSKSLPSLLFEDLTGEEMKKSISQKSSLDVVFYDTRSEIDKITSSTVLRNRSAVIIKQPERIYNSNENVEAQDTYDRPESVLSREALLLLTYLTICAFVFCCLKFSMACESLIS